MQCWETVILFETKSMYFIILKSQKVEATKCLADE